MTGGCGPRWLAAVALLASAWPVAARAERAERGGDGTDPPSLSPLPAPPAPRAPGGWAKDAGPPGPAGDGEARYPEMQAGQRLGGLSLTAPSPQVFGLSVVKKAEAGRRLGGGTDAPSPEALTRDPRDMFELLARALADPRIRPN